MNRVYKQEQPSNNPGLTTASVWMTRRWTYTSSYILWYKLLRKFQYRLVSYCSFCFVLRLLQGWYCLRSPSALFFFFFLPVHTEVYYRFFSLVTTTFIHTRTRARARTSTYTHTGTNTHARARALIHTRTNARKRTHPNTHTRSHTQTHTYFESTILNERLHTLTRGILYKDVFSDRIVFFLCDIVPTTASLQTPSNKSGRY